MLPAEAPSPDAASTTSMILVTGAGRSGTSTIAGTLHYLGFHVPTPVLKGNESNPRGFFESWWPVRFHNRTLAKAFVGQTDGRPEAPELLRRVVDNDVRAQLRGWLSEVRTQSDRVVVKDPRALWMTWLWVEVAQELGIEIDFLVMVRHPAEVLGSRQTYYADKRPGMGHWEFAIWNLCGWINTNLLLERQTRDQRRTFLLYPELLADWRSALDQVRTDLQVRLDDDLDPAHRHEVDDFIDVDLRRHDADWGDWELPVELTEIAEAAFEGLAGLAARSGHDEAMEKQLDRAFERYTALYRQSRAISHDVAVSRARQAKAQGADEVRAAARAKRAERQAQKTERQPAEAPAGRAAGIVRRFRRRARG